MGILIDTVKRLTREAVDGGMTDERLVFDYVKNRLAETVDTDPKRNCCVRASSMPPSVCAAVRCEFEAAVRFESQPKPAAARAEKRLSYLEARNVPFADGPKMCPHAGCSSMSSTPNSFATHASRCTRRPR